ncbi:MAG: GAF domain-containing protein [candidate division Zixibacteria bacterium]|nr:GAF domain-containing protein [candidate division Zixibacteria bacterium]
MHNDQICQSLTRMEQEGANLEKLLTAAVELLHNSNPRFHWTGIYELYPDNVLRLGPFVGSPTDHVFIAVGKGICGTAIAEKRNLNIPDVSRVENYLACSSSTKSELVVLIRVGDTIFAQIDIDSHELNAFDPVTVRRVELVAEKLAQAYQKQHTPDQTPESGRAR